MTNETRRQRALFAARLHVKSGTLLSSEAVADICAELLEASAAEDAVALENARLRVKLDVKSRPHLPPGNIE